MVLDPSEGRTMSDLAEAWSCDASNATFIVDRLEERAFAERRTVATDRRVKLVVLTAEGAAIRGRVLQRFFEPPPELLELSRADLRRSVRPPRGCRPRRAASGEPSVRGRRDRPRRAEPAAVVLR
jgi:DNA-binding MarR family transcriptional regulator